MASRLCGAQRMDEVQCSKNEERLPGYFSQWGLWLEAPGTVARGRKRGGVIDWRVGDWECQASQLLCYVTGEAWVSPSNRLVLVIINIISDNSLTTPEAPGSLLPPSHAGLRASGVIRWILEYPAECEQLRSPKSVSSGPPTSPGSPG